jgi:AraC-like DNA-binding protein
VGEQAEQVRLWRVNTPWGGVELLQGAHLRQRFSRHSHQRFPVGVIEQGALGFRYRGEEVVAPPGSVNLANPGEPHTGHPASEDGWTYRMFYLQTSVLRAAAAEIAGRPQDIPFFAKGWLRDDQLAQALRVAHLGLTQGRASRLESEQRLIAALVMLISRHADARPSWRAVGREPGAVRRAREFLEDHPGENVSLFNLAATSGLSPFHLARVFRSHTGLAPHQYQTQLRLRLARDLIGAGASLTQAALDAGFVDQAHLTRRFRAHFGLTPGRYRKMVQES